MRCNVGKLSQVCVAWSKLVAEKINLFNAPKGIIAPLDLAALKSRVGKLDLSTIKTNFNQRH
jgi:hypothetical protein